jgi:hypothetical protein
MQLAQIESKVRILVLASSSAPRVVSIEHCKKMRAFETTSIPISCTRSHEAKEVGERDE